MLSLRQHEHRAAAPRTYPLIMFGRSFFHLKPKSELLFDCDQIFNVHLRSERLSASAALRPLLFLSGLFVESDAQLSRPLEDMEELSERQPQQSKDDRDRMQRR